MGRRDIVIRAAGHNDIPTLARIHYQSMPDDFLPSLGQDFLEKEYYPSGLLSESASTLVSEHNGHIAGFVTIAHDSDQYTRDILRGHYVAIAGYALRAALRNPFRILHSAEILYAALFLPVDVVKAEIVYIAVDESQRRQGIGKKLVGAALAYLEENGISVCRTKTLASNLDVIAMYDKLGWCIRDQFRLIGRVYVTLVNSSG